MSDLQTPLPKDLAPGSGKRPRPSASVGKVGPSSLEGVEGDVQRLNLGCLYFWGKSPGPEGPPPPTPQTTQCDLGRKVQARVLTLRETRTRQMAFAPNRCEASAFGCTLSEGGERGRPGPETARRRHPRGA